MSSQDETLALFSLIFCCVMALLILVPYARGKTDLFTSFNLFLAGSFTFIGLSGYAYSQIEHRADYRPAVYQYYYMGFTVFYAVLYLSYRYIKFPRKLAGRYFRSWPKPSFATYLSLAILAIIISLASLVWIPIPFVNQVLFSLAQRSGPVAIVMAIMALRKDPFNPVSILSVTLVIGIALVLSLSFGGGRRGFFAVFLAFPVVIYWTWLRYQKRTIIIILVVLGGIVLFGLNNGLAAVRHQERDRSGVTQSLERIRMIVTKTFSFKVKNLASLAQDSSEVTLYTIHHFVGPDAKYDQKLFHAPYYIVANPIPRVFWEEKPVSLGYELPNVIGKKEGLGGYTTVSWGINAVAQGYHDGGLIVIAIYGFVFGVCFRYVDEWLTRQPNNPFLLGFMAAASSQFLGISRGSIDTMTIAIISCVLSFVFISVIGKVVFGSDYVYPRTDHILDFPKNYLAPRKRSM